MFSMRWVWGTVRPRRLVIDCGLLLRLDLQACHTSGTILQ